MATVRSLVERYGGSAPPRSLGQRLDALDRANDVRTRRARLKKDLKAGRVQIVALLADPPQCIETMKVFDLLLAVPKVGRVRVDRMLMQCRISQSKVVGRPGECGGGVSDRQRAELLARLRR
ncbi:MAG: integration host factor, actinobacterial type [Solirubrobacteraceae bacterium]